MKLLIIDYGTGHLERLRELCGSHELTVINGVGFGGLVDNGLDGVMVIGDSLEYAGTWSAGQQAAINLMQAADLPVFGLGGGFVMMCGALGVDLPELGEVAEGAAKIVPTEDGAKIFQGSDPILVHPTERWCFDELPRGIAVLARSESGIEALRSKSKPLYALQQLPNDFTYPSDGKLVIENFVASFAKK